MIPQHDSFYDVFSKAKKIKVHWPNGARLAVSLTGNLEAWTEAPDPKMRRTRHVGGSQPLTADDLTCMYDFKTASENDYGGRTGVWRILRILKKYDIKSSFDVNALAAIKYPEAVKKPGVVAGTTSHFTRAFPRVRVELEGGQIVKVGGGAGYGDAWRNLLEEGKRIHYPCFPRPGLFYLWEAAIGTNPKIHRPSHIEQHSSGGFEWERRRSGVIHMGFGTLWRAPNPMWMAERVTEMPGGISW